MSKVLKLTIKTLNLITILVEMEEDKSVGDLKHYMYEKQDIGIKPEMQQLIYGGRTLLDEDPLMEYSIDERKFLVVMSKPIALLQTTEHSEEEELASSEEDKSKSEEITTSESEELNEKNRQLYEYMANQPSFQQALRDARSNPEAIGNILTRINRLNRPLALYVQRHLDKFLQLLFEDMLVPDDFEVIQRLMKLGFSREQVLDAYFYCNKDEQQAIECLLQMRLTNY